MRRRLLAPLAALVVLAACASGDDPVAPRAASPTAAPILIGSDQPIYPRRIVFQPFRAELLEASAGLLYTSESDYPFDYVSRAAFLRDTLTLATFRAAFLVPRTTPVEVRSLDRFFARHIELVDPNDPAGVALIPRYENLKFQIQELLNAPKAYCVGIIQIRCYVVGTSPDGVIAGLATTSIET
jgi:Nuclease A inhibitor-like protein